VSRWFRFYDGALDDPKVQSLPGDLFKTWVNLLCVASRNGGCLPVDQLPFFLRSDPHYISEAIERLKERGLIDCVDEYHLAPHNWDGRQFKSDTEDPTAAERMRRYRASRRNGNASESNTARNDAVTVTVPRTETEADTEKKDIVRAKGKTKIEETTDHFEIWYSAYPLHKGRGAALRAYKAAILKTEIDVLLFAAKAYAKQMHGREKNFIPHPATWLNGQRWLDEDLQPPKPQEPTSNGGVYVVYGSDAGDAWERDYRLRGKIPPRDTRGGWYHPTEWPPRETSSDQAA
jgi:hypothetical protein